MNLKNISWNSVTTYSQISAIVLFVGIFALGFELGKTFEYHAFVNGMKTSAGGDTHAIAPAAPKEVVFACATSTIDALFFSDKVELFLSDKRHLTLPRAVSGSGTRYATADESVVFSNKGTTATLTENKKETYRNCVVKPTPQ